MDTQLRPVSIRLGITDGTNSELLSGDLSPGSEVVTNVITTGALRATPAPAAGNPLLPAGRGPGGFGGGGGRGR